MVTYEILKLRSTLYRYDCTKKKLCECEDEIKKIVETIKENDIEFLDYKTLKEIFDTNVKYYLSDSQKEVFYKIIEEKKRSVYPELNQATYFPQINQLNISDKEKRKMDSALFENSEYLLSERTIKKGERIGFKIEYLEPLYSIGLLKKYIRFYYDCCAIKEISEDDLKIYKRIWELISREKELSNDERDELDKLEMENGWYIYLHYADDLDYWEYEIDSLEEYENYLEKETIYKVCIQPDMKYEYL